MESDFHILARICVNSETNSGLVNMNYFICGDFLEKTSLFVTYNVYYLKLFSHRVKTEESNLLVGQTAPHGYLNAFYGGMKKVRGWK